MYRYQVLIEYVGTKFVGWQKQLKGKSIQKEIENNLSKLLKQKITIYGSGRTDAGVHAIEQSAHFDTKSKIQEIKKLIKSLNFFLNKKKISIINIYNRKKKFHARFSAKVRVYKYYIINRLAAPSLENERAWHVRKKLDIKLLKKGAKKLIGTHDFSTFRASNCYAKSPIKKINKITVKNINKKIQIEFRSKSFLRNQVRSMVGCLKYLAENKWDIKKFENVFKSKKRSKCASPAPAHGLFLAKIIY
ncbi:MAG: tRNA pseudouridine(38-40) synthase TruA [Pelagibacterales bacterium]|nr:tRNA pseudouridine(38-40) synthase TruA [Pelagibacterales bacterium]